MSEPRKLTLNLYCLLGTDYCGPSALTTFENHNPHHLTSVPVSTLGLPFDVQESAKRYLFSVGMGRVLDSEKTYRDQGVREGDTMILTDDSDIQRLVAFSSSIPLRKRAIEPATSSQNYDLFLSYAAADGAVARELKEQLEAVGLRCFMAEKDIGVAMQWEAAIHAALLGSKRVLVLITPRSVNRPWILLETGAAWALKKDLIPALVHVSPQDLVEPLGRYQARVIETTAQRISLVKELVGTS